MLKSMTGFGAGDYEDENFRIHLEIKAVNQRFLETNFHMGRYLDSYENILLKKIKEYIGRGKLDINVYLQDKRESLNTINVDEHLAVSYHESLNRLSDLLHLARPDDVSAIAAYPGIIKEEMVQRDIKDMEAPLLNAAEQALNNLLDMRRAEGANIQKDLEQRIDRLHGYSDELKKFAPIILDEYKSRIEKIVEDALPNEQFDRNRIIQEVALYADKVNYTEEIVRLQSHFKQFKEILNLEDEQPVGRRLDFLIQEINREANTIASKANFAKVSGCVVDLKCEIEKLREQIQNVE